jgi:hypothetical protein
LHEIYDFFNIKFAIIPVVSEGTAMLLRSSIVQAVRLPGGHMFPQTAIVISAATIKRLLPIHSELFPDACERVQKRS